MTKTLTTALCSLIILFSTGAKAQIFNSPPLNDIELSNIHGGSADGCGFGQHTWKDKRHCDWKHVHEFLTHNDNLAYPEPFIQTFNVQPVPYIVPVTITPPPPPPVIPPVIIPPIIETPPKDLR